MDHLVGDAAREACTAELKSANRILVFTGAGISTGSGIQDYRGPSGKWKAKSPVYFRDFMHKHESRVEYWTQKVESWPSIRDARPNAAHRAIVDLEKAGRLEALVTQNIDGLHQKAGTTAESLVEIHGTNLAVACMRCSKRSEPGPHFEAFTSTGEPPTCPSCGGWLKPATISFGQGLDEVELRRAFVAAAACELLVAVGSSLSVHPASSIPLVAQEAGARYLIINKGKTEHDDIADLRVEGDVVEILPAAVEAAL